MRSTSAIALRIAGASASGSPSTRATTLNAVSNGALAYGTYTSASGFASSFEYFTSATTPTTVANLGSGLGNSGRPDPPADRVLSGKLAFAAVSLIATAGVPSRSVIQRPAISRSPIAAAKPAEVALTTSGTARIVSRSVNGGAPSTTACVKQSRSVVRLAARTPGSAWMRRSTSST